MEILEKTILDAVRYRFEVAARFDKFLICIVRLQALMGLAAVAGALLAPAAFAQEANDQDVKPIPILQGSVALVSDFSGGQLDIHPLATPVVLLPIGQRWLFETRATFENDLVEVPGRPGFHGGRVQKEVEYAQLDFIANKYMTISVGRFLTPFGIFNERLYPAWIRNLQSDPLILPIGIGSSNASTGAMVRVNRNGAIHGFTLLRAKDRSPVDGWDFELKPGAQEFNVTAPGEPGEYIVVCTVVCGEEHEGMNMKVIVLP